MAKRKSFSIPRVWQYVALGVALLLTGGMVWSAFQPVTPPAVAGDRPTFDEAEQDEPPFPAGAPLTMLVLGDSLTLGATSSAPELAWVPLLTAEIQQTNPVTVTTVAQSMAARGVEVSDALTNLPSGTFDIVAVEVGTNDAIHSDLVTFTADYTTLLSRIREASPQAALACLSAWGNKDDNREFNAAIETACKAASGSFVNISNLHADESNRWAESVLPDGTATDNFHPNDKGHAAIAQRALAGVLSAAASD